MPLCKHSTIACIIILVGAFGGIVKYLNVRDINAESNKGEIWKYLLTGIGSALLIPLLLYMLSSDLIKADPITTEKYFIFAGFCFVAAFFSDRFIISIGERVLVDLKKTRNELNETKGKLEGVEQKQIETDETVGALVENETEPKTDIDINSIGDAAKSNVSIELANDVNVAKEKDDFFNEVLKTFSGGKFKFRTIDGIAKELKYPVKTIEIIVNAFANNGILAKVKGRDGREYWGLTGLGRGLIANSKS